MSDELHFGDVVGWGDPSEPLIRWIVLVPKGKNEYLALWIGDGDAGAPDIDIIKSVTSAYRLSDD